MTPALHAAARAPWLATWRAVWPAVAEVMRRVDTGEGCRSCGCSEGDACRLTLQNRDTGELMEVPCWWVEPGLCSGCAQEAA